MRPHLPSPSMPVIAVDIGSTNTHVGLVDTEKRHCLFRKDFPSSYLATCLSPTITQLLKRFPRARTSPAVIAGGRDGLARETGNILKKKKIGRIVTLRWNRKLPLRTVYKKIGTLGADRIADALYAVTAYPRRNVVVIDSGTAITVDAVNSRGVFIGGTILAGVGTQLRGLRASTSTLPALALPQKPVTLPGTSTKHCMKAGAAYGTAGALNLIVGRYKSLLGKNTVILATGGAWGTTKELVNFDFEEIPGLTLIGTALYASHCG